jgi:hypothetical protein
VTRGIREAAGSCAWRTDNEKRARKAAAGRKNEAKRRRRPFARAYVEQLKAATASIRS